MTTFCRLCVGPLFYIKVIALGFITATWGGKVVADLASPNVMAWTFAISAAGAFFAVPAFVLEKPSC